MSDLQKFIKQFFYDNNWSKECDFNTLPTNKIEQTVSSFPHIDVKSKLAILLSINSPSTTPTSDTLEKFRNIFQQALDDSNNLVRSVAAILCHKSETNSLNFDISADHEAFQKNLLKLLARPSIANDSNTPLLAEVINDDDNPGSSSFDDLGFRLKEKPLSVILRERYLEKLQEECHRKRVHVPIPGRSFNRNDDKTDLEIPAPSVFIRKRPLEGVNAKSQSNGEKNAAFLRRESIERAPINRAGTMNRTNLGSTKPGIKLLDFDDLPAHGPKAKQLRKEQQEKERERKKLEKEEKQKEMRAAKEAAKQAKITERNAIIDAKKLLKEQKSVPAEPVAKPTTPVPKSLFVLQRPQSNLSAPTGGQVSRLLLPFNYLGPPSVQPFQPPPSVKYTDDNSSSDDDDDSEDEVVAKPPMNPFGQFALQNKDVSKLETFRPMQPGMLRMVRPGFARPTSGFVARPMNPTSGNTGRPMLMKLVAPTQAPEGRALQPQRFILLSHNPSEGAIKPSTEISSQPRPILSHYKHVPQAKAVFLVSNSQQRPNGPAQFVVANSAVRPTRPFNPAPSTTGLRPIVMQPRGQLYARPPQPLRIQDDLSLTTDQASWVENLLKDANCVSRPEMAVIVSFMAGVRDNPTPEAGNVIRIRLSEYRETVRDGQTDQLMDMACETYLHLDYATGVCEQDEPKTKVSKRSLWASEKHNQMEGALDGPSAAKRLPEQPRAFNLKHQHGPLGKDEYEQMYKRSDKFSEVELREEEEAVIMDVIDEVIAQPHEACVEAAKAAWTPEKPPFIDCHFSLWHVPASRNQEIQDGTIVPPKFDSPAWNMGHPLGEKYAAIAGKRAVQVLRRNYTADDYEEQLEISRLQAEAEIKEGTGEMSPFKYAIHVQVTPCYSDNMVISSIAEEYAFLAGYVSWADLDDPHLSDRIPTLVRDPHLVGLRYDLTTLSQDHIMSPTMDANLAGIELHGLPFELQIGAHQLKVACHLAYKHPNLKFILNHCAVPVDYCSTYTGGINLNSQVFLNWKSDLEYLSRYPNVYCKLTGATGWSKKVHVGEEKASLVSGDYDSGTSDPEDEELVGRAVIKEYDPLEDVVAVRVMSEAVSAFGIDRCLFGSGWPVCRAVLPEQTGWKDCAIRRLLTSKAVDEFKAARAKRVHHECLDLWEAARLVEHCAEEAGFGSSEDKYKLFSKNATALYKLNLRPWGINNVNA
ncbi:Negative elongation factor A [Cichlidogyrus casuarinus]|uniref:Negative elongation factor A n=1 Tax=Cichlidogyrus casuarinus TaxID=1844966 RepID=A0ABD2QJF0_9PLAT